MSSEHVHEGLEHLQTAALELIAAARSVLDAIEELLRDPTPPVESRVDATDETGDDENGSVRHIRVS